MTTHTRTSAFALTPAALAAALFLASCGEDTAASAAEFNDADVMFAQMMIPHHEQAVEMSRLAESRAGDEVGELATEIEAAQGPEIEQLDRMLTDWGAEPAEDGGHEGMAGMMTEEQMAELEWSEGGTFDTLFLELMIAHHEGAVEMAQEQLSNGANPEARELAQAVVDTQESEIEQMHGMLGHEGARGSGDGSEEDRDEEGGHGDH